MDEGIEILGSHYSPRLKQLWNSVETRAGKRIEVRSIVSGDNKITLQSDPIILSLKSGATEGVIAHELMHGILFVENYPSIFTIPGDPSASFFRLLTADLDHVIINDRLADIGYDALIGYLRGPPSHPDILKLDSSTPTEKAAQIIAALHWLLKFAYYKKESGSEEAILSEYPEASSYWRRLKAKIGSLPPPQRHRKCGLSVRCGFD